MVINTYQLNLKNKINEQAEIKQTHRYGEYFDGCQLAGILVGWLKKLKGLRSINCLSQNSHGDIKYSIGITVNNIVIIINGVRWLQDLLGSIIL